MKRFPPVILTLLLVVALVMLYQSRQTIADLETELVKVKAAGEKPVPRVAAGSGRPAASSSGVVVAASTPPNGAAAEGKEKENAKEKEDSKKDGGGAADLLMGAGAKEIAARSQARINLLRDRLKLRADQVKALEKAAAGRNGEILASFERLRQDKGTPPDFGIMMDWMLGNHDLPVAPLLDAEQALSWSEIAESERTGRVEGMVNMELLELQSQGGLHLTPEQRDQVFDALSGIVAEEDARGAAYYVDDGQFMTRIDESLARRRAALATVLDEAMMQSYDRMLVEDREQIVGLFGSGREAR